MDFVFAPPPIVALPVAGSRACFPVHRVYCVGRNYAAHAREMGHDPDREPPFFFQKNPDSLTADGTFPYPDGATEVHHEIELAVALQSGGSGIAPQEALNCVFAYAVALDMTRRDLQTDLKRLGRPWEAAKAFEHSAPCSPLYRAAETGHPVSGAITLHCNCALRQTGDLAQLIWPVPDLISRLSRLFVLRPGDVILTGTPDGVGPVAPGDALLGHVEGIGELSVRVI